MYKEIEEGVNLFNEQDFFAAHDFFENLWINADIVTDCFIKA